MKALRKKTCPVCGKEFVPYSEAQKFCCTTCRKQAAIKGRVKSIKKGSRRTRRCHDCGKPTDNYRCEKCWYKLRSKLGLTLDVSSVVDWDI